MRRAELRKLRQRAGELVREAESGARILVTVDGRDVAQLGPLAARQRRRFDDIRPLFDDAPEQDWAADRSQIE